MAWELEVKSVDSGDEGGVRTIPDEAGIMIGAGEVGIIEDGFWILIPTPAW